jgi:hypothetical protein
MCVGGFREYHRERYQRMQLERTFETNRRVGTLKVRRHLRRLLEQGWTVPKLAAEAGCSCGTVWRVLRGNRRTRVWSIYRDAWLGIVISDPDRFVASDAAPWSAVSPGDSLRRP